MDIQSSPSGKLVRCKDYIAFVPHPLPPQLDWPLELVQALSEANYVIGKLSGEGNKLPNPHLLIKPFMAQEAVLSSRIEGTQATLGEVLSDSAGGTVTRNADDLNEVKNYIEALEYGLERLNTLPVSLRLLKELHEHLMQGVRGQHATPGEFRRSQNWIGLPGCTLSSAKYVPPPFEHLMTCLSEFELFLHRNKLPTLVQIALCHYQFEAIHPFLDGNGRLGRLLITLLLVEKKILTSPLLYLSAFFERTRSQYYEQLFSVSANGSWTDWLLYFLHGVSTQARDTLERAEKINSMLAGWQAKVAELSSTVPARIIHHLAANPFLSITKVAAQLGVAFNTAHRAIQKLENLGILVPMPNAGRTHIYCAEALLKVLEAS